MLLLLYNIFMYYIISYFFAIYFSFVINNFKISSDIKIEKKINCRIKEEIIEN